MTNPIRRRTRLETDQALPPEVLAYVQENFAAPTSDTQPDGEAVIPIDDHRATLLFMERHFSDRAYKEHRHRVLDRMFRAGRTVPEIALLFDKSERTVWRWKDAMTVFFSESFSLQDVRSIYVNRVADYADMMKQCDQIRYDERSSTGDVLDAIRTKVRVHAMWDQVLRGAGYNRIFDLQKMNPDDQAGSRNTEGFLKDLDVALLDDVPLLEHDDGES